MYKIAIISENVIFTKLLGSFLSKKIPECAVVRFSSFPAVKKNIDKIVFDFIIIDGIIAGVASFEIINYLRLEKKIITPIYFFSEIRTESFKSEAYQTGVNFYYEKPFDPHIVTNEMINSLLPVEYEY